MSSPVVSLTTEAAKAGDFPQKFNKREQKLAESAKSYVDTTAASVSAAKISDTAYNESTWNAVTTIAPSKNAVRDQVEVLISSIAGKVSDTAYNASTWDSVVDVAPSKNAIRDKIETLQGALTMGQGTTGTSGTVGQIAIAGMTSAGKVIVTAAEDPGTNLVISHVVAGTGLITVYTRTVVEAGTTAAAPLDSKLVNYIVIALS